MKSRVLIAALVLLACRGAYAADDLVSVAPDRCKILREDDKVRVIEFIARSGERIPMHSHPAHVVYFIKAGATLFTLPDGSTRSVRPKDGSAVINPAMHHAHEHVEDSHVILVELKQ